MWELLGQGIFNANGSQWKKQRCEKEDEHASTSSFCRVSKRVLCGRQVASHMFKVKELRGMIDVFTRHCDAVRDTGTARAKRVCLSFFCFFSLSFFVFSSFWKVRASLSHCVYCEQLSLVLQQAQGEVLEMQNLFMRFTLDSIGIAHAHAHALTADELLSTALATQARLRLV